MTFWLKDLLLWPSDRKGVSARKDTPLCWKSGWYASYWNAFLFQIFFVIRRIYHSFFFRSLTDTKDTWIGLYKPTRHVADTRWIDNTPFVFNDVNYYQPWFPGDPNERNAACVRIEAASTRTRDRPCGRNFWAVCERGNRGSLLLPSN